MIVRCIASILGVVMLAACSSTPEEPPSLPSPSSPGGQPGVEQQLQADGFTLAENMPPPEDAEVHSQHWKRGDHLVVEIVKSGPKDNFEIESIFDPKLERDNRYSLSCSASNKINVASSVRDFELARQKSVAAGTYPISEGSDIRKVDIAPDECLLFPVTT